jgi:SAM-dependent methyltransferase
MDHSVVCRICGAKSPRVVSAKEMMFGTRDTFEYRECSACGCVQIAEYPSNIGDYYARGYYSFHAAGARRRRFHGVESWLRRRRARNALGRPDVIGFAVGKVFKTLECYAWLTVADVGFQSSILDVGCGNGWLLANLHKDGFERLEGVDPFASEDSRKQAGFVIKEKIEDVAHEPDFVLLSHSLEHMPDQAGTLAALRAISGEHTWLCVRIPLANAAWRRFGIDWVQLDPPRHFYLHTVRSFRLVAERAGFEIVRTEFDSSALQFWGSEQIRRGIPFADPRGHARAIGGQGTLFTPREIAQWEYEAAELNRTEQGDQATFYLRAKGAHRPAAAAARTELSTAV